MKHRLTHLSLSRAVDEDLDAQEQREVMDDLAKNPDLVRYFQELHSLGPLLRETFPEVQPPLSATLAAMKLAQRKEGPKLLGTGIPWILAHASAFGSQSMVQGHSASRGVWKCHGRRLVKVKGL